MNIIINQVQVLPMWSESGHVTRFRGGKVVRGGELVSGDVWVRDGKILNPQNLFYEEKKSADLEVDCEGMIISPGFIDIQINGAFGVDFSSLPEGREEEGVREVSQGLLQHGVTAFCPTIVTSDPQYYHRVLGKLQPGKLAENGAAVLGVHLEGPFINREKKGAHQERFIKSLLSPEAVSKCYGKHLDAVKIVTLAPELAGAEETVQWLTRDKGMVVSLGHSMAQFDTAERAVKNGASLITHLFNAMLPFHHRDPGIVGLLTSLSLEESSIHYSLIADGYHTHVTVQRIAHKAHPEGVVLVTDAMAAMGLPDGLHSLGSMTVDVNNGSARLSGCDTLAGSVATMDSCVRQFRSATGCSVAAALEAASLHPARVLGLGATKGSLDFGSDGDLVILDESLEVQATFVGGVVRWGREGGRYEIRS